MSTDSRRLSILTVQEIDDLYGLPRFTEDDRRLHFDLSPTERDLVEGVRTMSAAVHLILQLGYFKAKCQFFVFAREAVLGDLEHILRRHFPARDIADIKSFSKPTRLEQQQVILKLFGYRLCDTAAKAELEQKAQRVARFSTLPVFILRELSQYLTQQRVLAPGYTYLQDLVGRTVSGERRRITQLLGQALKPPIEQQLAALLVADEGMYRISVLKHEPKDFSYGELRQEVGRRQFFQPLYEFGQAFLASAGLSNESVKYYASLVQFYTVYKLQRMPLPTTRLYLLCFAYHRFRQINDNLIDAFIHLVGQYEQQAKIAAETAAMQAMTEASTNLNAAGQVLNLFIDPSIPGKTPFSTVKQKAFSLLEPGRFPLVADYMRNIEFDKTAFEWSYYGTLQHKFKLNLRHLFCNLDFAGVIDDAPLLEAVAFLQALLRQDKSPRQAKLADFPTGVIAKAVQRYMYTCRHQEIVSNPSGIDVQSRSGAGFVNRSFRCKVVRSMLPGGIPGNSCDSIMAGNRAILASTPHPIVKNGLRSIRAIHSRHSRIESWLQAKIQLKMFAVHARPPRIWTSIADNRRFWTENADMFNATGLRWTYGRYAVRTR